MHNFTTDAHLGEQAKFLSSPTRPSPKRLPGPSDLSSWPLLPWPPLQHSVPQTRQALCQLLASSCSPAAPDPFHQKTPPVTFSFHSEVSPSVALATSISLSCQDSLLLRTPTFCMPPSSFIFSPKYVLLLRILCALWVQLACCLSPSLDYKLPEQRVLSCSSLHLPKLKQGDM